MNARIVLERPQALAVDVSDGRLGVVRGDACTWEIGLVEASLGQGAPATRVIVRGETLAFTFFARDVRSDWPIWIPYYGVAVLPGDDERSYAEVTKEMRGRGLQGELEAIAKAPEESFDTAAPDNRDDSCEVWLGVARDMRIFAVARVARDEGYLSKFYCRSRPLPKEEFPVNFGMQIMAGRGAGCEINIRRRLEEGVLPILHSDQIDGDINYHMTTFATLERSPLRADTVRGTHFLVADHHLGGHRHLEHEKAFVTEHLAEELEGEEQTVLMARVEAVNTGNTPHYAFLTAIHPAPWGNMEIPKQWEMDTESGFGLMGADYDPATESVSFVGSGKLILEFNEQ